MKKFYVILTLFFLNRDCFAQNYFWANSIGSTGDDIGNSITTDGYGNTYITGYFSGTADFDPGTGTTNLTSLGNSDIFFAKYDTSGNYIWAKSIGGSNNDNSNSIAIDGTGNILMTGWFQGTVDFDPGVGTAYLSSIGSNDIFFAKFDANGNYLWAKNIGNGSGYSITFDASGNVYITGGFSNTTDFDPGIGTANFVSFGSSDIFFAKYDNAGNYIWAKSIGSGQEDGSYSIVVDGTGNVYITGFFHDTADFDPGIGMVNLTSDGLYDLFFAKYDANGNYILANRIGATGNDISRSIVVDVFGNIYITGYFDVTTDFDPGLGIANLTSAGGWDNFVAKYDANGNYIWAKRIGNGVADNSYSIVSDNSGNVYIIGRYFGTVDFDPGSGITNLTSVASGDIFFAKYDSGGNYLWAKGIGSTGFDYGLNVATDTLGNVYIIGWFTYTPDFDPGQGTAILTSEGGMDIFFGKYSQTTVGMREEWVNDIIKIYPNPTNSIFSIISNNSINSIEIYNILGERIDIILLTTYCSLYDISSQPEGIYFLNIKSGENVYHQKLIKR